MWLMINERRFDEDHRLDVLRKKSWKGMGGRMECFGNLWSHGGVNPGRAVVGGASALPLDSWA